MGGPGSGRRYRSWDKKATVEESIFLAIADFRSRICPRASGRFTWTWAGGNTCSVGYFVTLEAAGWTVTLPYRWRDKEDIQIPILLQTTPTNFGGSRWWLTCPLIVSGVACNRRVGKLYLPNGARYFSCRHCHDLTYESSQKARQKEWW